MKKFKRFFAFLLSLCCLMTTVMNSSLTNVSAATQVKVEIDGNGGQFDVSGDPSYDGTNYSHYENTLDAGSSLADNNIGITNPVNAGGAVFMGWEVFDNTNPASPVKIGTGGISTADMLAYELPSHNILFRGWWDVTGGGNTGGGNTGGNQGSTMAEVMLYADGGDFTFSEPTMPNGMTGWSNFWVTPNTTLASSNITIGDAVKHGYIFKGWMECTYTIDSTNNLPICTPVSGAALRSSAEVMNVQVPSTGIAFIAQYTPDSRTYVNVFFNGNEGTFSFSDRGNTQTGCESWGNVFPEGTSVGAENPNLTISNPVFWDSNRAFIGWMACTWSQTPNNSGKNFEQIAGTGLMTTAQALAYPIPNEDLYFVAQYAGDDSDYHSMVRINGYGAPFTYDEIWQDGTTNSRTQEGWGSKLRINGTSIESQTKNYFKLTAEPSKQGANFEGWIEFKIETKTNKLGNEYEAYTLVSNTIYTTAQMLALQVPKYDVVYVAKWSDMDYDDYYTWVNKAEAGFNAEPGNFYFENPLYNVKPGNYNGCSYLYEIGTTLASNNVVVKDPTAQGYIFKGWKICKVEFGQNGPSFTQLPNTGLITTTDALNYTIPDYAIRFVAEWEQDTRPFVNVQFDGNDGELTVIYNNNSFNTMGYGDNYLVGSKVSDTNLVIKDPVFWDGKRAFEGWMICTEVEKKDDAGNRWFEREQVKGTKILSTVEALDYVIPNYDIVFVAQWAGNDNDYYSQVYINGYYTPFTFTERYWDPDNQQHATRPVSTQVWGNYLREDGTSLEKLTQDYFTFTTEPSRSDAKFEGWLEFKVDTKQDANGIWHDEYTLVSNTLYTTAQILGRAIPHYDVAYVAKWSDIPTKEYFAEDRVLFLSSNGGEITLDVIDENGNPITIKTTASECWYPNCYTVSDGLAKVDWKYVGANKQCANLLGWTIYTFNSFVFEQVPTGQELNVGDPDVIFVYFDTYTDDNNVTYDRYLGIINARMEFGYASTSQLMSFNGNGKGYFAIANWQDAHTESPYVIENNVEPTESKDGSYEKAVYCSVCKEELSRDVIITTYTSQTVKVEGSDESFKADTKSALTEVPVEIAEKYDSVAAIEQALEDTAKLQNSNLNSDKVKVEMVDVELKVYNEEAGKWELVDDKNFPKNGVTIVLPYPEGTNSVNYANYTFEIVHMITTGTKAGQTEVLTPVFKADGIHVTVTSLSPIGIVYQENPPVINNAPSPAPVTPPPVESEHTLANGKEVRMVTLKNDSTVYVIGAREVVPAGAIFECDNLTSGTQFEAAAKAVTKKFGAVNFKVYDMNLFNASYQKMSKLNDYINVTFSIPEGMVTRDGDTIVVYALSNGKLVKCDTAVANGQVTFATNHFSTYVAVEINTMTSPKTGDTSMMPMFATIMLFMFVSSAVIMRKKVTK